jgi:hypothetical protein
LKDLTSFVSGQSLRNWFDADAQQGALRLAEKHLAGQYFRRKEWEEASHRGDREKAGSVAASPVGERRSVRTVAQQQPNNRGRSRVKTKPFQEEKRQSQSRVP